MAFVFLFLAAFLNLTKSYCSKRISGRVDGFSETVDMTMMRNLLCAVIGALILLCMGIDRFSMSPIGWLICTVSGVAVGLNYIVWVLALKSGVYLLASASNSASFIVAALCGIIFFEEKLTVTKGAAILLILLAMLFMGRYQKDADGKKMKPMHLVYLFFVFLSAGISSVTQKWFTRTLPEVTPHTFTFYSLLISCVILLVVTFFIPQKKTVRERSKSIGGLFVWIALMAVCFYGVTYFQTMAAADLDAIVMYPAYNGTLLAAGSLMAWLCFGEKPNRNSIIGVILVFAAVVLAGL